MSHVTCIDAPFTEFLPRTSESFPLINIEKIPGFPAGFPCVKREIERKSERKGERKGKRKRESERARERARKKERESVGVWVCVGERQRESKRERRAKGREKTHCNTLRHTATHCNTLQHTATHCNTMQQRERLTLLIDMGWLRLVGSLKLYVSFAEYGLFYRALLQKRPII